MSWKILLLSSGTMFYMRWMVSASCSRASNPRYWCAAAQGGIYSQIPQGIQRETPFTCPTRWDRHNDGDASGLPYCTNWDPSTCGLTCQSKALSSASSWWSHFAAYLANAHETEEIKKAFQISHWKSYYEENCKADEEHQVCDEIRAVLAASWLHLQKQEINQLNCYNTKLALWLTVSVTSAEPPLGVWHM